MKIEKRVKLNDNYYFVSVDVSYELDNNGITKLILNNYPDKYFDNGDLSNLINKVEKNYDLSTIASYEPNIGFMADVLYLYDKIPFICEVKDVYYSKDGFPLSTCVISKIEIDNYIHEHNIIMNNSNNFKLFDETTWDI